MLPRILVICLCAFSLVLSAKNTTSGNNNNNNNKSTTTKKPTNKTEDQPLPTDPFTRFDSVITGKDADDLHEALTKAADDAAVTKANQAYKDALTKAENATAGTKSSAVDALKMAVKNLFTAEKAAVLKANSKLADSITKIENAEKSAK